MNRQRLKPIVEAALLAAGAPLPVDNLLRLFSDDERPEPGEIEAVLTEIGTDCAGRGFELVQVSSGYRFQVRQELAPWISRLWEERPTRYSRALLETLALIAYRQPTTRAEIEDIRGVSVSSTIMKTLLEREWIRVVGHRDVPGRPALYGTTRNMLDHFNLKSLDELPPLGELMDLDKAHARLQRDDGADLGDDGPQLSLATAAVSDLAQDATAEDAFAEESDDLPLRDEHAADQPASDRVTVIH
ncbi:MAG: segregation and condensation protein B [Gammaproteobacteria bacterium]|nr:MAG: segregation and condensation protein B [Gammaproteobacteria bacterium]TND06834.1 MAG: segregation and condensation protein B [Gammaproteobacteria bacterium]